MILQSRINDLARERWPKDEEPEVIAWVDGEFIYR